MDRRALVSADSPSNDSATPSHRPWLALGAIVGPAIFTFTWLVLGLVSPGYMMWDYEIETYSAVSQPVSGLGLGETAPFMNTAFVLMGILVIVGAVGIFQAIPELTARTRRSCTALVSLHGAGAIIDGVFPLESILMHTFGFLLALSTIVSFMVVGHQLRQVPRLHTFGSWLIVAGPATLLLAILYFATFDPEAAGAGIGIGGVTQRILLLHMHGWLAALGWVGFRHGNATRLATT